MKTKITILALFATLLFSCNNPNKTGADNSAQVDSKKTIYFGGDIIN